MKQIFAMGLAVAAMVVAGCSKVEPDVVETGRYIQTTSSIDGVASKTPIEGTDVAISDVAFVRADDAGPSAEGTITFAGKSPIEGGSRAAGGVVSFGSTPQQYDQAADKTAYFLGYRPTVAPQGDVVTWILDGKMDVMTTNVWNAGRYTAAITSGMVFKHELARLEVICKAEQGSTLEVVQSMWGTISSIKLKGALPSVALSYENKTVTATGAAADFALLKGDYSTAFVPTAIQTTGSLVITAAAMVAPIDAATITLLVKTAKLTEKEIAVTLTGKLDRAKTHKVTLTFKANGKDIECTTSTIEDWADGATAGADVAEPEVQP